MKSHKEVPTVERQISGVFKLTKRIGKQNFRDIFAKSCGYKILRIDMQKARDKQIVDFISEAMTNFLASSKKSGTRYKGNRANDVGKKLEPAIIEELKKTALVPRPLGSSGYPDLYVEYHTKRIYLELKTSAQKKKATTHHRLFYFTSGKKVKFDAHHLLLQVQIEEEADKYWRVVSWQLRDLYSLRVSLKTEWNANYADFEASGLLVEGS
jgi:hypothetical protein